MTDLDISEDRSRELKMMVSRKCKSLLTKSSHVLSLQGALADLPDNEKRIYLELLVEELNTKYPDVRRLDLTWNALSAADIHPLATLKCVKSLDIESNNLDGSTPSDAEVLAKLQQNIDDLQYYQRAGSKLKC